MLIGWACALPLQALDGDEAARIQRERREAAARYAVAEAACPQQFAVNACLEQAHSARRAALDRLNQQQLLLDDSRRRERAAQRALAIARKAEQTEARDRAAKHRAEAPAASAPAADDAASRPAKAGRKGSRAAPASDRSARAEQRRVEAEQHRLEVLRRNAELDAKRPRAAGLPVP